MPVKSGERNRFITLDAILPPFHRDIDMGDWIFVIEKLRVTRQRRLVRSTLSAMMKRMRILIAPDKFKGSLGERAVAEAIAAGLRAVLPEAVLVLAPVADGGEGTAEVIREAQRGEWRSCPAHDAFARPITARYAWLEKAKTAVIEMSEAAGMRRLAPDELAPIQASTFGVGEMLLDAAACGAAEIIVGLGGSATNDGGFGLARALGFRFENRDGGEITGPVSDLLGLARIKTPNEPALPRITAAADVSNPLLGPHGATRTFSPQKGATPDQLELLERSLTCLAEVAAATFHRDNRDVAGAGAAGGLGFGLLTFCNARMQSGFEVVAEAIALRAKVERADIVITGEGKLDRQTLAGKAPAGLARMARELNKPVFAIVGQMKDEPGVRELFDGVMTLDAPSQEYRNAARQLELRARELAITESVFAK